jgi:enediyne biosynthesis protein E3
VNDFRAPAHRASAAGKTSLAGEATRNCVASRLKVWLPHLKHGSIFAVKLRHRAGTVVEHTELACQTLSGLSSEEAVRMVNAAFLGRPPDGKKPAYEILRRQVQVQLAL